MTTIRHKRAQWVIGSGIAGTDYTIRCERCGDSVTVNLPAKVDTVVAVTNSMIEVHKDCPAPRPDGEAAA